MPPSSGVGAGGRRRRRRRASATARSATWSQMMSPSGFGHCCSTPLTPVGAVRLQDRVDGEHQVRQVALAERDHLLDDRACARRGRTRRSAPRTGGRTRGSSRTSPRSRRSRSVVSSASSVPGSYGSPPQPQMNVSKSGAILPSTCARVISVSLSDAHHLDLELDPDLGRHLLHQPRGLDVVLRLGAHEQVERELAGRPSRARRRRPGTQPAASSISRAAVRVVRVVVARAPCRTPCSTIGSRPWPGERRAARGDLVDALAIDRRSRSPGARRGPAPPG